MLVMSSLYKKLILFSLLFSLPAIAAQWELPEGIQVPTVFFQGMMDSHKQCAKYCGPDGFQALTGQQVKIPNAIELINRPFIGKELDEIKLSPDGMLSWYNPLNLVDAIQRHAFAKQLPKYGYEVTNTKPNAPTITTHAVDFFKINFAQERDIAECSQKIALLDQGDPSKPKILWGVSRGAAAIFDAHARHNYAGVRMVVLEGCFDTIGHTMALRAPAILQKIGATSLFASFLELVSEYRRGGISPLSSVDSFPEGVPVVFVISKADRNVPMACARELIKRLKARGKNPVHVITLKQSGHNYYALGDGDDQKYYLQRMHALYKKYGLPYVAEYISPPRSP